MDNQKKDKSSIKDIKLVDNKLLEKISKQRYYIQPIYSFMLFIIIAFIIYSWASSYIVESLGNITTVNVTLFAVNLALLVFIVPCFIKDKIRHLEAREQIKDFKRQGKIQQSHLEKLKDIDVRIVLDSQTLNLLYFQTILLVSTFCISILFLAFMPNDLIVASINGSHIIVEILYIINLLGIIGIWMHTKDLQRLYADMVADETNLLNNSGSSVYIFTKKDMKDIKRKQKK